MASLIKNQILKHLSKFTKNLSPDKIHVSTLKGEGELSNLELDEKVLMELLDLPTWLQLSKAVCNRVAIKIQWTKLKTQPICLFLDEIVVDMETCEKPRQPSSTSDISSFSTGGKYGFAERIIDGMYVSINSVIVNFKAPAFNSSIQLSRILIASKTPTWQTADLRLTRIKDELRGEILIFKEAEWQTLRIEANALSDSELATTPLRLIANQSKTRITIKKRLADCAIVASRVQLNLDDLLWVLTDSQLKAALVFVNSLKEVIKKSSQQSKQLAAQKLRNQSSTPVIPGTQGQAQRQQRTGSKGQVAMGKIFSKYDVQETSYHLYTGRIDLHLCDDVAPEDEGYRRKVEGGAMQMTLHKLSLDHYPYHSAGGDRAHWLRFDENMMARNAWAQDLLDTFKGDVRRVRQAFTSPPASPEHMTQMKGQGQFEGEPRGSPGPATGQGSGPGRGRTQGHTPKTKLLESGYVFRLEDFALYRVSTANDNKRSSPRKFLSSDKKQLLLPQEMSSVHMEYTDYYFPDGIDFPVPHANMFAVINPLRLHLDYLTILWLNAFSLNLLRSVDIPKDDSPKLHVDIKLDALMPRIILPAEHEVTGQPDRPDGLQIQASRLTLTNCRIESKASYTQLNTVLGAYEDGRLFHCKEFPREKNDLTAVPETFRKHVNREDDAYVNRSIGEILTGNKQEHSQTDLIHNGATESLSDSLIGTKDDEANLARGLTYYNMSTDSLKLKGSHDVWCISIDQFWAEFVGVPNSKSRPVPFVESFPLSVWISLPLAPSIIGEDQLKTVHSVQNGVTDTDRSQTLLHAAQKAEADNELTEKNSSPEPLTVGDIHMLVKIGAKVNIELNHYQYLFLLRLIESITKHQQEIKDDTEFILEDALPSKNIVLAVILKEMEFALVCPPIPEVGSLGGSQDSSSVESQEDLYPDGTTRPQNMLSGTGKNGTDSALGNSVQSDVPSQDKMSLQQPQPIRQSHSDTEILSNHSSDPTSPLQPTSAIDIPRGQQQPQSGDASPKILISDGSSVSMVMGGSSPRTSSPMHMEQMRRSMENVAMRERDGKKGADVRKSFNSALASFSKFTDKVKANVKKDLLDIGDDAGADDWESGSIKSGASSDDEEFVVLKLENERELPAFERRRSLSDMGSVTDVGSDNRDPETASVHTLSSANERHHGVVSVVSFRFVGAEMVIQVAGDDLSVSANVDHVLPTEHGNVNLDKFQARFANAGKDEVLHLPPVLDPPVKLSYKVGPRAELLAPTAGELGFLCTRLEGFSATLAMSTMSNFIDLIEDELIPKVMPLRLEIVNSDVTLKNDLPPTHPTSPGAIPLDLHVDQAIMSRGQDGVFNVTAGPPLSPLKQTLCTVAAPGLVIDTETLQQENEELKKRLKCLEGSAPRVSSSGKFQRGPQSGFSVDQLEKESDELRRQLEKIAKTMNNEAVEREAERIKEQQVLEQLRSENRSLVEQLTHQQDEILTMKEERESLLTTIQLLQEELTQSEQLRSKHPSHR